MAAAIHIRCVVSIFIHSIVEHFVNYTCGYEFKHRSAGPESKAKKDRKEKYGDFEIALEMNNDFGPDSGLFLRRSGQLRGSRRAGVRVWLQPP